MTIFARVAARPLDALLAESIPNVWLGPLLAIIFAVVGLIGAVCAVWSWKSSEQ